MIKNALHHIYILFILNKTCIIKHYTNIILTIVNYCLMSGNKLYVYLSIKVYENEKKKELFDFENNLREKGG